jgi:hypothetical protein
MLVMRSSKIRGVLKGYRRGMCPTQEAIENFIHSEYNTFQSLRIRRFTVKFTQLNPRDSEMLGRDAGMAQACDTNLMLLCTIVHDVSAENFYELTLLRVNVCRVPLYCF